MMLFGIAGNARSGKDTVCEYLCEQFDLVRVAFADPVKAAAAQAFGISIGHFYDAEFKEKVHPSWGMSPREIAQRVGTECFRREFGPEFWIRRADVELRNHNYYAVVPDIRFQEEADFIVEKGGFIIHLTRPGATGNVGVPGHASEAGISLSNYKEGDQYAQVSNTGTIEMLYEAVETAIQQYVNPSI